MPPPKFTVITEEEEKKQLTTASAIYDLQGLEATGSPAVIDIFPREETPIPDVVEFPYGKPVTGLDRLARQSLAGLANSVTEVPAVFGLVGTVLETLAKSIPEDIALAQSRPLGTGASYEDFLESGRRLVENFGESIQSGVDNDLLTLSAQARRGINNKLDIAEAKEPADQVFRALTTMFPMPGFPKGGNLTEGVLGTTANIAFPLLRYGPKGNRLDRATQTRIGLQSGIAVGADQVFKEVLDSPDFPPISDKLDLDFDGLNFISPAGAAEPEFTVITDPDPGFTVITPEFDVATDKEEIDDAIKKRIEIDRRIIIQEEEDGLSFPEVLGAIAVTYAGIKYGKHLRMKTLAKRSPFGLPDPESDKFIRFIDGIDPAKIIRRGPVRYLNDLPGVAIQGTKDLGGFIRETGVDRTRALVNGFTQAGHSRQTAERIAGTAHTDPVGEADMALRGHLGQGFTGGVVGSGRTHSTLDLNNAFFALSPVNQKLLDEGMLAATIVTTRTRGEPVSVLWGKAKSNDELRAMVDAARAVPEVRRLMERYAELFRDIMDYMVYRDTFTPEVAARMTARMTDPATGIVNYMPLYSADVKTFYKRLKDFFGKGTQKGEEFDVLGELMHRSSAEEIARPLSIRQAMGIYVANAVSRLIVHKYSRH